MLRTCGIGIIAAILMLVATVRAEVKCASVFGDHMVLQRDAAVPVWGTADANEQVTVKFARQSRSVTADAAGKWMVKLSAMPAGGPFELTVGGTNTIKIIDVLVGEVWICSGQSNMQWSLTRSNNAEEEIAAAKYPGIRLCFLTRKVSRVPLDAADIQWKTCTPEDVPSFSAVGYFFGRHLHKTLDVPVGLIHTNWGGTVAEAWTEMSFLQADRDFKPILDRSAMYVREYPKQLAAFQKAIEQWKVAAAKAKAQKKKVPQRPRQPADSDGPNNPAVLYNGMIRPLVPYAIRGAIWYQGESNVSRAFQYRKLLPAMIGSWRKAFSQGDFPFHIVQLANYGEDKGPNESAWAELREAQYLTAKKHPNCGLAVTIDIGNPKDIHPRNKQEVGRRLGLVAEKQTYGREVEDSGPEYVSMAVEGNAIRVKFQHVAGGLVAKGVKLEGFAIADAYKKFVPAEATIDGDSVVVSARDVKNPTAVRYGWAASPVCNLYNKADLPAIPFRTDDWPCVTRNVR